MRIVHHHHYHRRYRKPATSSTGWAVLILAAVAFVYWQVVAAVVGVALVVWLVLAVTNRLAQRPVVAAPVPPERVLPSITRSEFRDLHNGAEHCDVCGL
jgi:hypothetical protein